MSNLFVIAKRSGAARVGRASVRRTRPFVRGLRRVPGVGPTRRPPPRVARSGRSRPLADRSVGVPRGRPRRPSTVPGSAPSPVPDAIEDVPDDRTGACRDVVPDPSGSPGERGRSHRRAEWVRRTTVRAVTSATLNPTTASGVAVRGCMLRRSTRARDARGPTRERGQRARTDARWPKRRVRRSGAGHTTRVQPASWA